MFRALKWILPTSALLFLVSSPGFTQGLQPGWLALPQKSVAMTDDALSILVNPAGLGVQNGWTDYFLLPYRERGIYGNWGYVTGGTGFGFAMEVLPDTLDWNGIRLDGNRRRYTWGLGTGDDGNYFGFAYSWTTRIDRQNTWDLGYLGRPLRYLSYGFVARGVNEPRLNGQKQPVVYDAGISFRPLALPGMARYGTGDRLTIFADARAEKVDANPTAGIDKEAYLDNLDLTFGAAWKVVPGIAVKIDFSPERKGFLAHDARLSGGLELSFGHAGLGNYQQESQNGRLAGVSYIYSSHFHHPTVLRKKERRYVVVNLRGPVVEMNPTGGFLFASRHRTIFGFQKSLSRYEKDPDTEGVVLKIWSVEAGWAKLQEMRNSLEKFKASGKKVVAYLEDGSDGAYYLASVADKIYLAPGGGLMIDGIAAQGIFVKGTLAKIGIEPQLEHIGKYKSASEMFTREDMSDGQREATNAILDDLFEEYVKAAAAGRAMSEDDMRELIDKGPFSAAEALKNGLVDSLVYEDQIEDLLKVDDRKPKFTSEKKYALRKAYPAEWGDARGRKVAIVYGVGGITSGESSSGGLFGGESMGSATVARALKNAREDDDVAAVVFRIDSPGGSGLASDVILREVKRYHEGDNKKPIIVSMSDVAGSGGYYIACHADTIIALPNTITGSIGVISGKFAVDGLYRKIALNQETIKRGKFADMYWASRPFTDEEWEKLRVHINQFYQLFVNHVAEGRGMDTSAVNAIGQGRIWSGTDGKSNGLVDLTGGLDMAIELAAKLGGIRPGDHYEIAIYPRPKMGFSIASDWVDTRIRAALPEPLVTLADRVADDSRWKDGEILMLMPVTLKVE